MFNVALVGIGNISFNFDFDTKQKTILSHAKALYQDTRFDLKYCVDIDNSNEVKIKKLFPNILFYTDVVKIIKNDDIDVVVIATPTSTHFEILEKFKNNSKIKYFLVEKPLFLDNNHFDLIETKLKKKIIINYIRIFEPNIQNLKNKIQNDNSLIPQKFILTYTKGIKNNGSHFIGLLSYLFDNIEIENIHILDKKEGLKNDSTLDIVATLNWKNNKVPLYIIGLDHNNYAIFEIDFYFNKMKIKIEDTEQTLLEYKAKPDSIYKDYITLQKNSNVKLNFDVIMKYPYDYIYNLLKNNTNTIDFITIEKNINNFYKNLKKG